MPEHIREDQVRALGVPSRDSVPVFAAPWEASAFALVVVLYKDARFEWREWVALLSAEIAASPPDETGERYYEIWTKALEKLLVKLALLTPEAIAGRAQDWRAAYLATPHGQEVRLGNSVPV